jgi:conjugative relaxase-like TrwC/TraI family protein
MVQSSSAAHAKAYFADALSKADYYIDGQEMNGYINGKIAARLGLNKEATKEIFEALCENLNPSTSEQLTPRTREDRTVGYDINFHCPKSVSIVHALTGDLEIQKAFESAVQETMLDIESDALTRVRKNGVHIDRETGELIWADFTHHTARPVEGHTPDPHLHSHCFVFNVTYDKLENQFKAGQFRDIKRDMPFYQARFHKRLSDKLIDIGYNIKRTDKSFELSGVPENVVRHFSKRTDEIGRLAKEMGITDPDELNELGARTRSKKQKGMTMTELRANWKKQIREIGEDRTNTVSDLKSGKGQIFERITSQECVDNAIGHTFERASVMDNRRILEKAYRHGIGSTAVQIDEITNALLDDKRLIRIKEHGRFLSTTKDVLNEEKEMVTLARLGQGAMKPLYRTEPEISLDGQQGAAVRDVLTNRNQISIIRGAAGSGKTTLLKALDRHIDRCDKQLYVLAPTAQASRGVLVDEGFKSAETVAKFLQDKSLQDKIRGQVLCVDEAGLLGTQDMLGIIKVAREQSAKLVLCGDTKQHASVVRGDALRILNTVAGIQTSEVNKIYRQKEMNYKTAVEHLSKGYVREGFERLDMMGAIVEIDPLNPNKELVSDYVNAIKKKKSAIIVSPTNKQGRSVTDDVRNKLRSVGILGKSEVKARRLTDTQYTEAEKSDWRNYNIGHCIQFNQNLKGVKRGSQWMVSEIGNESVIVKDKHGNTLPLPRSNPKLFDVYNEDEILLSKGDKIHITKNSFDKDNKRLNNGQALEVVSVKSKNLIHLINPVSRNTYTLDTDFSHLSHAYCITSHSSQGKTVDSVFISQPASTFPATNAQQFYVSVSRGRDNTKIYTDDKEMLLRHAAELNERRSAMEMMDAKRTQGDCINRMREQEYTRESDLDREIIRKRQVSHEPEL